MGGNSSARKGVRVLTFPIGDGFLFKRVTDDTWKRVPSRQRFVLPGDGKRSSLMFACSETVRQLMQLAKELRDGQSQLAELPLLRAAQADLQYGVSQLQDSLRNSMDALQRKSFEVESLQGSSARLKELFVACAANLRQKSGLLRILTARLVSERLVFCTIIAALAWICLRYKRRAHTLEYDLKHDLKCDEYMSDNAMIVRIECPGVSREAVKVYTISNGLGAHVQITRGAFQNATALKWERTFRFCFAGEDFEMKEDESRMEDGCVFITFRACPSDQPPRLVCLPELSPEVICTAVAAPQATTSPTAAPADYFDIASDGGGEALASPLDTPRQWTRLGAVAMSFERHGAPAAVCQESCGAALYDESAAAGSSEYQGSGSSAGWEIT